MKRRPLLLLLTLFLAVLPVSAQNFLDHFPGAALDSRWTAVTASAGTVAVADSRVTITDGNTADDAAFIHTTAKIDKTKSQLWVFAVRNSGSSNYHWLLLVDKATAPVVDTFANFDGIVRARATMGTVGGPVLGFSRFNTSHVKTDWNTSASAWQSGSQTAIDPIDRDDYVLVGFEIDGPGARFRFLGWFKDATAGYTYDQGLRLFAVSDWTAFSFIESSDDLWLVCGWPYTDVTRAGTMDIEWVRFGDTPPAGFETDEGRIHAWVNGKPTSAGQYTEIKHWWSYDGDFFVPEDRTTVAIPVGAAAAWDETKVKDKTVLKDGNTYYIIFAGEDSGGVQQLGLATATDPDGPWTKDGSNPIITRTSGQDDDNIFAPFLIKDESESDGDKRWRCFYGTFSALDSEFHIFMATAPTPDGTWTKQGEVLGSGGVGDFDENGAGNPVVFRSGGIWEIWYSGVGAGAGPRQSIGRATTSDLDSTPYTKDGAGARIDKHADALQDLSANLSGGRIASMTSTTGFVVDAMVFVDQNATDNDYGQSRIRLVNTDTSLELYHSLDGFTTASSAQVRQVNAGAVTIHDIRPVDGVWRFYVTPFSMFTAHATFGDFNENTGLLTSSTLLGTKTWNWLATPVISKTDWNHTRSSENIALVRIPFSADSVGITGPIVITGPVKVQ